MGFFDTKEQKQLDALANRIQMNFENNYKDAALLNLKEYEELLAYCKEHGKIKESKIKKYEDTLEEYRQRTKNHAHKDQKPKW